MDDDESEDEFFSGPVVVAISIVVTFIITLVVIAPITYIITRVYYKRLNDRVRKSLISQEGDPHEGNIYKGNEPVYDTASMDNVTMDTATAYATTAMTNNKADSAPANGNATVFEMDIY